MPSCLYIALFLKKIPAKLSRLLFIFVRASMDFLNNEKCISLGRLTGFHLEMHSREGVPRFDKMYGGNCCMKIMWLKSVYNPYVWGPVPKKLSQFRLSFGFWCIFRLKLLASQNCWNLDSLRWLLVHFQVFSQMASSTFSGIIHTFI